MTFGTIPDDDDDDDDDDDGDTAAAIAKGVFVQIYSVCFSL